MLAGAAYDALSLEERVEAATDLMHLALDMPTVRATLERRTDELERSKRSIREAIKTERTAHLIKKEAKRDAAEARASAKAAAEANAAGESARLRYLHNVPVARERACVSVGWCAGQAEQSAAPAASAAASASVDGAAPSAAQDGATPMDATSSAPPAANGHAAAPAAASPAHDAQPTPNGAAPAADAAAKPTPADLAALKLPSELAAEAALAAEAEARQREALGRKMHDAELANAIRDEALGLDRRFNRYRWYGPLRGGETRLLPDRVLFESSASGAISMFRGREDVDAVRDTLDVRGAREAAFARALACHKDDIDAALAGAPAPPAPLALPPPLAALPEARRAELSDAHFKRLLGIQTAGMAVLGEDGEVRATDYLPSDAPAVRKVKGELMCVESAIPEQAMVDPQWERVAWIRATQVRPHTQTCASRKLHRRAGGDQTAACSRRGAWSSCARGWGSSRQISSRLGSAQAMRATRRSSRAPSCPSAARWPPSRRTAPPPT